VGDTGPGASTKLRQDQRTLDYLYRAVDKEGTKTVAFPAAQPERDIAAASAVLSGALNSEARRRLPHKITLDGYAGFRSAAKDALGEHSEEINARSGRPSTVNNLRLSKMNRSIKLRSVRCSASSTF